MTPGAKLFSQKLAGPYVSLTFHKHVVLAKDTAMALTTTRGRKSAASLQIVGIATARKPLPAPGELSPSAKKLWDDIVSSLPGDFFRPGDLPLLRAYVVAADRKNTIDAHVLADGIIIAGEPHPGLKLSHAEASIMGMLAGKLRLCQSSRTRPESASLKKSHGSTRPWDDGSAVDGDS